MEADLDGEQSGTGREIPREWMSCERDTSLLSVQVDFADALSNGLCEFMARGLESHEKSVLHREIAAFDREHRHAVTPLTIERQVKQANTRSGGAGHTRVCAPSRWRQLACTTRPIRRRRAVETAAEGSGKHLMAGEADTGRNRGNRAVVGQQSRSCPFETQPQDVLLRRFAGNRAERTVKVEG